MNEENKQLQPFLSGSIDRFENNKAVIKLDDGQKILWSKEKLPQDTHEGSSVRLLISTSKTDEEEKEKIAKSLLNELLKSKKED